jgi:hypothetical protein
MNNIVALAMSGVTVGKINFSKSSLNSFFVFFPQSSLRFPGILAADLRKMRTNLIPFKNTHFLTTS